MKRSKSENAVFMLTRYVRGAEVSQKENVIKVTNYTELSAESKVGLTTFVQDCPNVVKPTNQPTELRIV